MKIEFCDLKRQYSILKNEINFNINKVLNSGKFINGVEVEELEKKLADFVGVKYGVGVASGTDALLISLMCLGINKEDYVITTPFTFISSAEVISDLGAIPIFVDICEKTYNINPEKIKEFLKNPIDLITKSKIPLNKIKGIIAVDLFGQCANYEKIKEICKEYNLFLIEDGAQSFGAEHNGKKACSFGDVSATSFFPSKPLGCYGDGGMIFTNNPSIAEKARIIRNHGQIEKYSHKILGMNSRLDSIQAGILLAKFNVLEKELIMRRKIAEKYGSYLKNILKIILPFIEKENSSVFAQYSILTKQRNELKKFLDEFGIPNAVYYPIPLHLQEAFKILGYKKGDFPISEKISNEIISLPMDAYKTEEEIKNVCDKIKDFYDGTKNSSC